MDNKDDLISYLKRCKLMKVFLEENVRLSHLQQIGLLSSLAYIQGGISICYMKIRLTYKLLFKKVI